MRRACINCPSQNGFCQSAVRHELLCIPKFIDFTLAIPRLEGPAQTGPVLLVRMPHDVRCPGHLVPSTSFSSGLTFVQSRFHCTSWHTLCFGESWGRGHVSSVPIPDPRNTVCAVSCLKPGKRLSRKVALHMSKGFQWRLRKFRGLRARRAVLELAAGPVLRASEGVSWITVWIPRTLRNFKTVSVQGFAVLGGIVCSSACAYECLPRGAVETSR